MTLWVRLGERYKLDVPCCKHGGILEELVNATKLLWPRRSNSGPRLGVTWVVLAPILPCLLAIKVISWPLKPLCPGGI